MLALGKYRGIVIGLGLFLLMLLAILGMNIWLSNQLVSDVAPAVSSLPATQQDTVTTTQQQFKLLQFAAIGLSLVYFVGIMFALLRDMQRRDVEVDAAREETDNILGTVNEGLFLLDRDLEIGIQQSEALRDMFGIKDELEGNFMTFIGRYVPDGTVEIAADFIELLLGERVKEKLIGDLNPLNEVEISIERRDGSYQNRYLNFQFKRVLEDKKVKQLLVSVTDVTREVLLARELEETKEQSEAQMDLLVSILHIEPRQLALFLDNTQTGLNRINETLKQQGSGRSERQGQLAEIFREAHKIKGEAAALNMHSFEIKTHEFEEQIEVLRQKPDLAANDLLPLTVSLKSQFEHLESVRDMVIRFSRLQGAVDANGQGSNEPVEIVAQDPLTQLAQKVAERRGVQVMVSRFGLSDSELPEHYRTLINDATIQFVRNAVAHGIEAPDERLTQGKSPLGQVAVSVNQSAEGEFVLVVRDDGRGLNPALIRETAIAKGLITDAMAKKLSDTQTLGLLFKSGFSTAEEADLDAGRGVGLDIVGAEIKALNGKISIGHQASRYCQFRVVLPAVSVADEAAIA